MATNKQLETFLHYQIEMNEYLRQRVVVLEDKLLVLEAMLFDKIEERSRLTQSERLRIKKRDNFACVECGSNLKLQVHHIVPFGNGGSNEDDNLVTLCLPCHIQKHEADEQIARLMRSQL